MSFLPSLLLHETSLTVSIVTKKFEPGKTCRLRIVDTIAFSMFLALIEAHEMEFVGIDGVRLSFRFLSFIWKIWLM